MEERKIRRIGVYGGTFSPPHRGHMHAAEALLSSGLIDSLLIIPTFLTPLKEREEQTSPADRLHMCRLAFSMLSRTEVSDVEIRRRGPSYTSETLTALAAQDTRLFFLCGTDMFLSMKSWHDPATVFRVADIVCMRRENETQNDARLAACAKEYEACFDAKIHFLTVVPLPMSSTEIRLRLQKDEDISEYLLPSVEAYIKERRLYE